MEFDKSRVYTAVNADEVKVGSKGYFADTLSGLKSVVESVASENKKFLSELKYVLDEEESERFMDSRCSFELFYLVEEPQEKKFRPYKDTDEMTEDFKRRYNSYGGWSGKVNPMCCPLVWVKDSGGIKPLVTSFRGDSVLINDTYYDMKDLLEYFTYLDGTPVGIEI